MSSRPACPGVQEEIGRVQGTATATDAALGELVAALLKKGHRARAMAVIAAYADTQAETTSSSTIVDARERLGRK